MVLVAVELSINSICQVDSSTMSNVPFLRVLDKLTEHSKVDSTESIFYEKIQLVRKVGSFIVFRE